MSGHTTGPWVVSKGNIVTINDPFGQAIAQPTFPLRREFTNVEFEANARLIAAAPELLAALEEAVFIACSDDCSKQGMDRALNGICSIAQAAIAKATGEA